MLKTSKPDNVFLEAAPCFSANGLLLCAYGNPTIFAHPVENGGSRKKTVPFRNAFDWLGSENTGSKTAHFIHLKLLQFQGLHLVRYSLSTTTVGMKYATQPPWVHANSEEALIECHQEVNKTPKVEYPNHRGREPCARGERPYGQNRENGRKEIAIRRGKEKPDGSDADTTPGIRTLSPLNRDVWGTVNAISASSRRAIRSRCQM